MNFFKRATTSILRRPGKSIILLLLVFILGSVIAGAISVRGAINNTDANLRRQMRPIVSVAWNDSEFWSEHPDVDWDDPLNPWNTREVLSVSHVRQIADLSYVGFYDYMMRGWLSSFDLEEYWGDEESWRDEGSRNWFGVKGTSNNELVQIEEGIINLLPGGRQFNDADLTPVPGAERSVAIISSELADLNNLTVGSTFELYDIIFVAQEPDEEDNWHWEFDPSVYDEENIYARVGVEFEVIGIFEIPEDPDPDPNDWDAAWRRRTDINTPFVPNWIIEDVQDRVMAANRSAWSAVDFDMPEWMMTPDEERETEVIPIFMLEDPGYLEDFRTVVEPLLPEFHSVEDLSGAFGDIESSMATMQGVANWILWVSVGATLLILSLLITLFLRDRRYEMGVYLALGEKKGRIISQILMEVVVTSFVAITLAVFTGNIISGVMSETMLRNALIEQAEADQNDDPWMSHREWSIFDEFGIPTTSMSTDEMMDAFQISLSVETVGLFYMVGLGAVVLSTMAPVLYVVTLNPKKVLM